MYIEVPEVKPLCVWVCCVVCLAWSPDASSVIPQYQTLVLLLLLLPLITLPPRLFSKKPSSPPFVLRDTGLWTTGLA